MYVIFIFKLTKTLLNVGRTCQINIDDCASMPCQNSGTCIDKVNGFMCNCTDDFMGLLCEKPYDACGLKPCKNNGTCYSTNNKKKFTCNCLPGNYINCDLFTIKVYKLLFLNFMILNAHYLSFSN